MSWKFNPKQVDTVRSLQIINGRNREKAESRLSLMQVRVHMTLSVWMHNDCQSMTPASLEEPWVPTILRWAAQYFRSRWDNAFRTCIIHAQLRMAYGSPKSDCICSQCRHT